MLGGSEEKKVKEVYMGAETREDLKEDKTDHCQGMDGKTGCKWFQSDECVISNKKCLKL